jgi:hypothetical protein
MLVDENQQFMLLGGQHVRLLIRALSGTKH